MGSCGVSDVCVWLGYSFRVSAGDYVVCLGGLVTSSYQGERKEEQIWEGKFRV